MADTHQITCVNKSDRFNPHERILFVGGVTGSTRWKISQQDAIDGIESGKWALWVSAGGKSVWVIVAVSRYGNKYIKTESDGDQPDNLLSLPECL